jgi:hypothetical protein
MLHLTPKLIGKQAKTCSFYAALSEKAVYLQAEKDV